MDNDKISRQALLDEINEEIEYGEEHFRPENEQINKGLKIARKLARTAPSVDNGWISVKDRLPDDKKRYLICTEDGRVEIAYYQPIGDKFSNYESFWQGRSCRFTAVTRWQPLPEPPKGE